MLLKCGCVSDVAVLLATAVYSGHRASWVMQTVGDAAGESPQRCSVSRFADCAVAHVQATTERCVVRRMFRREQLSSRRLLHVRRWLHLEAYRRGSGCTVRGHRALVWVR
jgi:hypothetical protein